MTNDKTIRQLQIQEKQLLDAIHAVFKKSDLLKGQPPPDKILLTKASLTKKSTPKKGHKT